MDNERFEAMINEKLDGKWNMLFGHRMTVCAGYDEKDEKITRERLQHVASKRNLDLKIERLSKTMPDILVVTFEARESSQVR